MRYYGGKNHLFRRIINLIPEHERFVELFAGSAAVARNLARRNAEALVAELDKAQAARLRVELPGHRVLNVDGIALLAEHLEVWGRETVIFADPPYPLEDRRDSRARYNCELTNEDHARLAELLRATRARVLVCGHPWGLYPDLFQSWRRHEFPVILRSGNPGVECLWTNYDPAPLALHDYRYYGDDKRVRQDLRRQVARQVRKFEGMNVHVRAAVLRELVEKFGTAGGGCADRRRQETAEAPPAAAGSRAREAESPPEASNARAREAESPPEASNARAREAESREAESPPRSSTAEAPTRSSAADPPPRSSTAEAPTRSSAADPPPRAATRGRRPRGAAGMPASTAG